MSDFVTLASELKAHNIILKRAILDEKSKSESLELKVKDASETSRRHLVNFVKDLAKNAFKRTVSFLYK